MRPSRGHSGFTLVELMVVIVVVAVAGAVAVMSVPDPRGRVVDEAERFAARARAARDEAVVTARPVSLWVTAGGYGFDRRAAGRWVPAAEKPLRLERWRPGTRVGLPPSGRERVTFDPTGLADQPLDLRLSRDRADAVVHLEPNGRVGVDAG